MCGLLALKTNSLLVYMLQFTIQALHEALKHINYLHNIRFEVLTVVTMKN